MVDTKKILNDILGKSVDGDNVIYKDEAGNTLNKRFIKTRNRWQLYGKNREGKVLCPSGFNELTKKAKLNVKSKAKVGGIEVLKINK
jgi:hypothetical protein